MASFKGIVIVDVDAKIPLADRAAYAVAQQDQLKWDFEPAWDIEGLPVRVATPSEPPLAGEIQMRLLDKPTLDGALGYHDRTEDGTPIAYIFCGLAKLYGDNWTSIASHEALELSADPFLSRCVQMKDGFWDMEIADRVEQDTYSRNGVLLSNFNTPECFEPPTTLTGVKFDHLGLSTAPNQVRPGGYSQKFDPAKGWVQMHNGDVSAYRLHLAALGMGRGKKRVTQTPRPSFLRRLFSF